MELALPAVPEWAHRGVEGPIRHVAPCGHYRFPLSYLDAVDAIGCGKSRPLVQTCIKEDSQRKERMADYAFCLDAWAAGARPDAAADELAARTMHGPDWRRVCPDLWQVLGEHTEIKDLLVERVLQQTRLWLKATVWDDDAGTRFGRDTYAGDWQENESLPGGNGNPELRLPGFRQERSPRVRRLEARLTEICPDWHWFRTVIGEFSWPCAPKAFRCLEKTLWCIGRERPVIDLPSFPLADPEPVPGFLQCADTCPDRECSAAW